MSFFTEIASRFEELEAQSKDFIRPQHVKQTLKLPIGIARAWLAVAARAGYLKKQYLVRCPTCHNVVALVDNSRKMPKLLECHSGPDCGEFDPTLESSSSLEEVYVYRKPFMTA